MSLRILARRDQMVHGLAGDRTHVFVTEPLAGRVVALDRATGAEVAVLPAPPGGYRLPFTLRTPRPGVLVILDPGGVPAPDRPTTARLIEIDYTAGLGAARVARIVSFAELPVPFAEDVEVLADGTYVVSEAALGALWLVERNGTIRSGLVPSSPEERLGPLAPGAFAGIQIDDVWFAGTAGFAPGVGSLAVHGRHLYFGATAAGGIHRIPIAVLCEAASNAAKVAQIETVSACPGGVVETLKGLTFAGGTLYATDPFRSQILRIDPSSGAREVVVRDPEVLQFPVCAQVMPGERGPELVVAADQEHRMAAINHALTADTFRPPFVVAMLTL